MNDRPIAIGLVGAGFVAQIHARSYARLADLGARVVAVASSRLSTAQPLASLYGAEPYDNYLKLLDRDDIDIVDLCVPNNLHEPFVIEAAKAGKHIICEKPLTGYYGGPGASDPVGATPRRIMLEEAVSSADRMLEAVQGNGVQLGYAENWIYSPIVQKARRLVAASGGTIIEIRGQECHSGSHASYAKSWKLAGGGALVRLATHPLGCAMFFKREEGMRRDGKPIDVKSVTAEVGDLTKIASVQSESEKFVVSDWQDVETWATMLLTFTDGSRATIFGADTVLGGMDDTMDIYMSNGRVRIDMCHSTALQAYAPSPKVFESEYLAEKLETKAGWSYPSLDEEWTLGYPDELRDFVESVIHKREPLSNGRLGRDIVKVMYSAYLSAEQGRRIDL